MAVTENDDSPVYLKLRAIVAAAILRGEYRAGTSSPRSAPLPQSRGEPLTVAKAYQTFQDDGYVEVRRGVGMFVLPGAAERLRLAERERFLAATWPRVRENIALLGLDLHDLLEHA